MVYQILQHLISLVSDIISKLSLYDVHIKTIEADLTRITFLEKRIDELEIELEKYKNDTKKFRLTLGSEEIEPWFIKVEKELAINKALINSKLGVTDIERYATYDQ